jgi:hypothetical protein
MLASMPYKSLRNLRAFTKSLVDQAGDPEYQIMSLREMTENGAVANLERFLKIYEKKLTVRAKDGDYRYTQQGYDKIKLMTEKLGELAGCYRQLEERIMTA